MIFKFNIFLGFAKLQGTIRNGRRCSTSKAYLVPADHRENLHIVAYAHVTKVIIYSELPKIIQNIPTF